MKRWDGTAWVAVQRVFVGQATLNVGTIISLITYAYGGFYQSAIISANSISWWTFDHNLGIPITLCDLTVLTSSGSPTSIGDLYPLPPMTTWDASGRGYYGEPNSISFPLNRCSYILYVRGFLVPLGGGAIANPTWQTSGFFALIVRRSF